MCNPVVIAMCGKTHSGKTTFGKRIHPLLPKSVLIDHDSVAEFLNKEFHEIHNDPEIISSRTPTNPDLRLLIPQLIYDYSLKNGYHAILTASHSRREIRRQQREIAQRYHATFILIFFCLPIETLQARVQSSIRSTNVLTTRNFAEELTRQNGFFEHATPDEADHFFEIRQESDLDNVENKLKDLLTRLLGQTNNSASMS